LKGSALAVDGYTMCAGEAVDGVEVADDEAAEAPLAAQNVGEQPGVGGAGHAVVGAIGCHDG
jgi:hypothetical protein